MAATKPTAPFTISNPPINGPPAWDWLSPAAPVAAPPAAELVASAAAVLAAAAMELVDMGTSAAERVPHSMHASEPGFC